MKICADTNQYIDVTTMLNTYKRRLLYDTTNNDFKMHANGNSTVSLSLTTATLATNNLTCSNISCTGPLTTPTTLSAACVHLGMDSAAAGGIEICLAARNTMIFAILKITYKGRMSLY